MHPAAARQLAKQHAMHLTRRSASGGGVGPASSGARAAAAGSPKPPAVACCGTSNGRSAATGAASTATVILTPQQAAAALASSASSTPAAAVFECAEETSFYSSCIEKLVLNKPDCPDHLVEFGAGDGSAVLAALLRARPLAQQARRPLPATRAYELSPTAAALAAAHAASCGLQEHYVVTSGCFWSASPSATDGTLLISNPPYLPAPDDAIMMPGLWGGVDGAATTCDLLSAGFQRAMLLVSGYSNPLATLDHAARCGYRVADFALTLLPFGTYSSEPRVAAWIADMARRGQAFYSAASCSYVLAGVLFDRRPCVPHSGAGAGHDVRAELAKLLTAL